METQSRRDKLARDNILLYVRAALDTGACVFSIGLVGPCVGFSKERAR